MLVSSDPGFSMIVTKCFIENAMKKTCRQKRLKMHKGIKCKQETEYLGLQQLYTYICMHNIYPLRQCQMEIPWLRMGVGVSCWVTIKGFSLTNLEFCQSDSFCQRQEHILLQIHSLFQRFCHTNHQNTCTFFNYAASVLR